MFYCEDDFIYEIHRNSAESSNANFDIRLQSQWNSAMENGYFRYRLNIKHSRILPGKYSFLVQVKDIGVFSVADIYFNHIFLY
jgi:preprotein translocase subunit SecB